MGSKKHIEHEVEKTLHALDGIEQAKTDDFFYSRLQAKIEQQNEPASPQQSREFGFAFSVAAVVLILILNVASIYIHGNYTATEESSVVNYEEQLMADYQLFDLSYYTQTEE